MLLHMEGTSRTSIALLGIWLLCLLLAASAAQADAWDCSSLPEGTSHGLCIFQRAAADDDPGACAGIVNDTLRETCLLHTGPGLPGGEAVCKDIVQEQGRDRCYWARALGQGESRLCENISNHFARDACRAQVGSQMADVDLCIKVVDTGWCAHCLFSVFASGHPRSTQHTDDVALVYDAFIHGDIVACGGTEEPQLGAFCQTALIVRSGDVATCRTVPSESWRDICVERMSLHGVPDEACASITDAYHRDICYTNGPMSLSDVARCDLISDAALRSTCNSVRMNWVPALAPDR